MKFLIIATLVAVAYGGLVDRNWEQFKLTYGKRYTPDEEAIAHYNFRLAQKRIFDHNRKFEQGLASFHLGLNEHSDMSQGQRKARNGFKISMVQANATRQAFKQLALGDLPANVDWRQKGVVTPIKDQGGCGSCWAFSAVGSMEGAHALKTGKLVSLSEQNLVDCDQNDSGCGGGLPDNAFKYVIANKGIDTESSYPYEGIDDQCKFKSQNIGATYSSYVDIAQTEDDMKKVVATIGPISVGIDASSDEFSSYTGGIFDIDDCTTQLDHGVTIVGYGTENGKDYWLIKNSWGTSWGIQGYMKMVRGKNMCGINLAASYPVV